MLAPSLDAAQRLVPRLAALPEVSRTVSLASFIPAQQEERLALIGEAAKHLAVLAGPPRDPPSDAAVQESLASELRNAAGEGNSAVAVSARRLADAMERLHAATPEVRAAAAATVVLPLKALLDHVRTMLQAEPITRENLPRQLVANWVARDGKARIEVLPRAGQETEASLRRFGQAVQSTAPEATGAPIDTRNSGDTVVRAFLEAGAYSLASITIILVLVLRRARDVLLTLIPVLLSGLLSSPPAERWTCH